MTDMQALIKRLEEAREGSRELDAAIHLKLGNSVGYFTTAIRYPYNTRSYTENLPAYTTSLDAALTLVPEGDYWLIGAGKVREDEPLYGVQIMRNGAIIAEAEHDGHPAIALCIAALKARQAKDSA